MNIHDTPHAPVAFDNTYARLPERFYARLAPTPVREPRLVRVNEALARDMGLDPEWLSSKEGIEVLAGNRVPDGADPIAMAYAGHQFGTWVPQLGDGRAILLGEVVGGDGVRRDLQLKGAGQTPFSRMGDGRAWLGPVLREYVVSEGMAALGIATTRALAAVTTGEDVVREQAFPGAVLARVARSHVRVGTFQFFAARRDTEALRFLADYVIDRHYPETKTADEPYRALLAAVIESQARLVARWQLVGFIHGVMNTDNMSVAGETIDYGPCAFMDTYHPQTVYSSIDHMGRYAYVNQPGIAQWNLAVLAQSLLPLLAEDDEAAISKAQEAINMFPALFKTAYLSGMRAKLGLQEEDEGDEELVQDLLDRMATGNCDFTLLFRRLSDVFLDDAVSRQSVRDLFTKPDLADDWLEKWAARVSGEGHEESDRRAAMRAVNPVYIPRNHLVEEVIAAAVREDDFKPFEQLLDVLSSPFKERPGLERYTLPPRPEEVVHQTFCGT